MAKTQRKYPSIPEAITNCPQCATIYIKDKEISPFSLEDRNITLSSLNEVVKLNYTTDQSYICMYKNSTIIMKDLELSIKVERQGGPTSINTLSIFECINSTIICHNCTFHIENNEGVLFTLNQSKIM